MLEASAQSKDYSRHLAPDNSQHGSHITRGNPDLNAPAFIVPMLRVTAIKLSIHAYKSRCRMGRGDSRNPSDSVHHVMGFASLYPSYPYWLKKRRAARLKGAKG